MPETSLVKPLFDELVKGTPKDRVNALAQMRKISEGEAVRSEFIVMGYVPKLIEVMSRGEISCRTQAAGVIANIAATDACRAAIIAAGALPPLVLMLSANVIELQEEAAGALHSLAPYEQSQLAILAAGALGPLIELLSCSTSQGKLRAAGAIGFLASHLPKEEVVGFLPALVAMLSSGTDEVSGEAADSIRKICTTCPKRVAVMEAGAVEPLLELLRNSSLRGRARAAAVLGNLVTEGYDFEATGEKPRFLAKPVVDAGAVPGLVALLTGGAGEGATGQSLDLAISNNASTQAARTLSLLATDSRTHEALIADGAIPALLALLQGGKGCPTAKGWVASTLEQLGRDSHTKKEIYAAVPLVAKTHSGQKLLMASISSWLQ